MKKRPSHESGHGQKENRTGRQKERKTHVRRRETAQHATRPGKPKRNKDEERHEDNQEGEGRGPESTETEKNERKNREAEKGTRQRKAKEAETQIVSPAQAIRRKDEASRITPEKLKNTSNTRKTRKTRTKAGDQKKSEHCRPKPELAP